MGTEQRPPVSTIDDAHSRTVRLSVACAHQPSEPAPPPEDWGKGIFVLGHIAGQPLYLLVDTGAAVSVLARAAPFLFTTLKFALIDAAVGTLMPPESLRLGSLAFT